MKILENPVKKTFADYFASNEEPLQLEEYANVNLKLGTTDNGTSASTAFLSSDTSVDDFFSLASSSPSIWIIYCCKKDGTVEETYCGGGKSCADICQSIPSSRLFKQNVTEEDSACLTVILDDGNYDNPKQQAERLCRGLVSIDPDYCNTMLPQNGTFDIESFLNESISNLTSTAGPSSTAGLTDTTRLTNTAGPTSSVGLTTTLIPTLISSTAGPSSTAGLTDTTRLPSTAGPTSTTGLTNTTRLTNTAGPRSSVGLSSTAMPTSRGFTPFLLTQPDSKKLQRANSVRPIFDLSYCNRVVTDKSKIYDYELCCQHYAILTNVGGSAKACCKRGCIDCKASPITCPCNYGSAKCCCCTKRQITGS